MVIWITYYETDMYDNTFIDKIFDSEEKAKDYIKYKDKMTGDFWNYFERFVE